MSITIQIMQSDFVDAIRKMALPTVAQKDSYFFATIAPKIYPDGRMEWIAKSTNVTAWVRVRYTMPTGVTEPIRIPMDVGQFLQTLELFSGSDLITFVHDPENGLNIFSNSEDGNGRTIKMPTTVQSAVIKDMYDSFPVSLEEGTEVILLKSGQLRPNVSGTCNIKLFNDLISNTARISGKTKKEDVSPVYHIFVDETLKQIKTVAGSERDRNSKVITDVMMHESVTGTGSLHYSLGFADICSVLSGEVTFHAVDKGPLWLMQDTDRVITRYLIPPATYKE